LKIKIDENIGRRGIELLRQAGHDVMSVPEQGLSGAPDETFFHVCVSEGRTLITLDRDFGQVPRFPPKQSAGIVILELGTPATLASLQRRLREFL
jgi:predicted nuclease of predicted toxin-antitoxin system